MYENDLEDPRPTNPFFGYSFNQLKEVILAFQTPQWCSMQNHSSHRHNYGYYNDDYCNGHPCKFQDIMKPVIDKIGETMNGLKLGESQRIPD